MSQPTQQQGSSPRPRMAMLGGTPSVIPDVPICAVFMAIYLGFAATNMTIFQKNRRRHYKFLPSVFIFGFCMARVMTLILRMVWATKPTDQDVAIAAGVFTNAGILIIYVVNTIFAQRILRAEHPQIGWNRAIRIVFKVLYVLIVGVLAMVITALVLPMNTTNLSTIQACADVQRAAGTYLLVFVTLPLWLLGLSIILPSKDEDRDNFGQGSMQKKKLIVATVACLSITIAGFKTGTGWMPPRPASDPAWYHSKAAFYVFNFVLEYACLCVLTFTRVDKLFFVPNGSNKPGDYTRLSLEKERASEDAEAEAEAEGEKQVDVEDKV